MVTLELFLFICFAYSYSNEIYNSEMAVLFSHLLDELYIIMFFSPMIKGCILLGSLAGTMSWSEIGQRTEDLDLVDK